MEWVPISVRSVSRAASPHAAVLRMLQQRHQCTHTASADALSTKTS